MTTNLSQIETPLLDESALDAIRALDDDGGDSMLQEILAVYIASCPDLLAQMDEGLATGDADKVRMATHTLKSSSANLGAQRLADLCRRAETAARSGDLATVKELASGIAQAYKLSCEALTRTLDR
jgi:two-component system, sensor histidine kinase and response regulator